jgi:hypothetical protein
MVWHIYRPVSIVIRKHLSVYLPSRCIIGGGIVFDSVEEDEYIETINKLGANVRCIDAAEGESPRPEKAVYNAYQPRIFRILRQDGRHCIGDDETGIVILVDIQLHMHDSIKPIDLDP